MSKRQKLIDGAVEAVAEIRPPGLEQPDLVRRLRVRTTPLDERLRRIRPWTAMGFLLTSAWMIVFSLQWFWLALAIIRSGYLAVAVIFFPNLVRLFTTYRTATITTAMRMTQTLCCATFTVPMLQGLSDVNEGSVRG